MYCRKKPPAGERPEEGINLPMKGAVCLDCGYVAMMVDINQLHAPVHRPQDAAAALARRAGAAAHLARSPKDEAAEALEKLGGAAPPEPSAVRDNGPPEPTPPARDGSEDVDFGDLTVLLDEAERKLRELNERGG